MGTAYFKQLNHNLKKLAAILCLSAMATAAYPQGLVNFFNGPATQISAFIGGSVQALPATAGQYYFALLTAPTGSTAPGAFTFSGITGTNVASAGRFTGGFSVPVPGWAPGTTRAFRIVAWTADLGAFNPAWITAGFSGYIGPPGGGWGVSAIAPSGTAGGPTATGSFPPLNVFGGTEGIQAGFIMFVPEPTSMALAGLGAAALLIFRRRR